MKKKLIVFDGHTLNPGDLNWDALGELADCEIRDRTRPEDVEAAARDFELVLTNKAVLSGETIRRLPKLEYIGVLATGYNVVDLDAANERGIPVTNIPAYSTKSVAQLTMALMLELTMRVGDHSAAARSGRWASNPDFCFWDHPLTELDGLTFGIVGFGSIGSAVAALARAFGMKVLVATRRKLTEPGVEQVGLEELLKRSDFVSLHCPLTPETNRLINAERIALMKPTAFLINTSRGPLIDEPALAKALNEERIAGAAVDVLSTEPPSTDNPLLSVKNCIVTPHIAWATLAARKRLMNMAVNNVRAFLDGTPQNVVNEPSGK